MNLFTKWTQVLHDETAQSSTVPIPELVEQLQRHHLQLWWSCKNDFPTFRREITAAEHGTNEKLLDELCEGLLYELKHLPAAQHDRDRQKARLISHARPFAGRVFNLEPRHLEFIEESRLLDCAQEFARMARKFDPRLGAEEIYQAGRNVMTMNLIQLLFGLPVEVTPSVFAYSMLYPYTDNYLDNAEVSQTTKLAFNHRFQRRLAGESIRPANPQEIIISDLIGMIEQQWDRSRFPRVYESLLAIHAAQVKSLGMVAPGASPYELDVLGVSFEKGGTSVLADGYLVAGQLTPAQATLLFGYGCFTQLMDDLEDLEADLEKGQMTIFSQTARHWTLDNLSNHLFAFGRMIFSDLNTFTTPAAGPLKEVMDRVLDPLLINSMAQVGSLYSRPYINRLERHFPFRFAALHKQRERITRQKITLERLLDAFLLSPE
jgi:hypothetical protein